MEAGHDEHGHDEHGHDHGPEDPHFWFDPIRVKLAVNEMAYQLAAQDPANASVYADNAASYGKQLDELHAWIQEHVKQSRRSAACWSPPTTAWATWRRRTASRWSG